MPALLGAAQPVTAPAPIPSPAAAAAASALAVAERRASKPQTGSQKRARKSQDESSSEKATRWLSSFMHLPQGLQLTTMHRCCAKQADAVVIEPVASYVPCAIYVDDATVQWVKESCMLRSYRSCALQGWCREEKPKGARWEAGVSYYRCACVLP